MRRIRSRIQSAGCDIGLGRRNRPSTTQDVPAHPQEAYEPPARLNHCGLWGRPSSHLHGGTLRPSDSSGHQGTTRALCVPARPLQANGPPARACTPCDGAQGRHKKSLLSTKGHVSDRITIYGVGWVGVEKSWLLPYRRYGTQQFTRASKVPILFAYIPNVLSLQQRSRLPLRACCASATAASKLLHRTPAAPPRASHSSHAPRSGVDRIGRRIKIQL